MNDGHQTVSHRFGQAARRYASAAIHARGADLDWLIEAHPLTGDERVLDIGTGTGHVALAFAPHVATVEGLDITPEMLDLARAGAAERGLDNVAFIAGAAENIPRTEALYDVVVSRWCAHHYQDIRGALAEIARVLRPGGVFLLVDAVVPAVPRIDTVINTLEKLRDGGHVRNYSLPEWLQYTEDVGLHPSVLHEWALRLDGDDWIARIGTPAVYEAAIRQLLADAEPDSQSLLGMTGEHDPAGWGFNLPAMLLKATKHTV